MKAALICVAIIGLGFGYIHLLHTTGERTMQRLSPCYNNGSELCQPVKQPR